MNCDLVLPDDLRWREALERMPHDVYHSPEYLRFAAAQEGGEAVAFYAQNGEAELLAPVILRPLPVELGALPAERDATTPYGYGAPLLTRGATEADARGLLSAMVETARTSAVVSAFFRLHPLLHLPRAALESHGKVHRHGETVVVDLTEPLEKIHGGFRSGHAYEVRKLAKAGFTTRIDEWTHFSRFVEIYLETMRRVSADDFYLFSEGYFEGMKEALGASIHLCTTLSPEGEVAASGLFSSVAGTVQYLFSGTSEPYRRQAPTKLMLASVIEWGRSTGAHTLHLGGGVGARHDSLFRFKAGFSELRKEFSSYRMIIDPERYATLTTRWRDLGGSAADGFFPEYRSPHRRS